jgi:hypothetical protein
MLRERWNFLAVLLLAMMTTTPRNLSVQCCVLKNWNQCRASVGVVRFLNLFFEIWSEAVVCAFRPFDGLTGTYRYTRGHVCAQEDEYSFARHPNQPTNGRYSRVCLIGFETARGPSKGRDTATEVFNDDTRNNGGRKASKEFVPLKFRGDHTSWSSRRSSSVMIASSRSCELGGPSEALEEDVMERHE